MTKPFFVMIYTQDGTSAVPMTDIDIDVKFFESATEAHDVANRNHMARAFGYEVFELGDGEPFAGAP